MHSIFLVFMWRRKLVILASAFFFLISIWVWAIFYTASIKNRGDINGKTTHKLSKDLPVFSKYGHHPDKHAITFVPPTRHFYSKTLSTFKEHLKFFEFREESEKARKNLDLPSKAELNQRMEADRIRHSAEMESHYEHELQRMGIPVIAGIGPGGHAPPVQRLVHLDLKGAPPKIIYLKRLLPILKSLGATGLLIEYEDMFPYTSTLSNLSAKNAYSKYEIKELLHGAASLGLSVMPLVQSFGHLEFALKLKDFSHLREVPESPQSICPSLNNSLIFIEEMITQVVDLHQSITPTTDPNIDLLDDDDLLTPSFTHIHIGCDEVFRMGECPKCKSKNRDKLFLSHVRAVAEMVKKRWPNLKIVIWDDMLRRMPLTDIQISKIGKLVEPMIWVYVEDIYKFAELPVWDKYARVFSTVWVASSFKGAHGEQLLIPPARRHLENNLKWLAVIQSESPRFTQGITGIVLTGWQRYDHFAVLCELLPTAIPSLAICLSTIAKGYFNINVAHNPIFSALTCPEPSAQKLMNRSWIELDQDPDLRTFSKCMFPGSPIFRFMIRFTATATEARDYLDSIKFKKGWMTDYNVRHNFSSPIRVDELTVDITRLKNSLNTLANNARDAMQDVYDEWTISEFIELHIRPLNYELFQYQKKIDLLLKIKVWPRRPIPYVLERK